MKKTLFSALEGFSSAVPASLGAVIWLGYKIDASLIAPMVSAMLLGLAICNFTGSFSRRPLLYVARFFEISLLIGFVDLFVAKLPHWGLADSGSLRLTWVMCICILAALIQVPLYALQFQRLTKYIPTPVFAGFLNALALILVLSQFNQIWALAQDVSQPLWPILLVAAVCFLLAAGVRHFTPRLPAGLIGLIAASATGYALNLAGVPLPSVIAVELDRTLPTSLMDSAFLAAPLVIQFQMITHLIVSAVVLAVVVFINTIVASDLISQVDDRPEPSFRDSMRLCAGKLISACLGSAPLSGAPVASLAAMRPGGDLSVHAIRLFSLLALSFAWLGLMAWLPQGAIFGLLLFEAWCLFDRPSVIDMVRFVFLSEARKATSPLRREDLLTVAVVTLAGLLFNMVTALLVGIGMGLILFARRNGRTAVRDIRSGRSIRSNVARSAQEASILASHGDQIKCVRLQGALYFGMARSLREDLSALLSDTKWLVLDWQAVTSHDSTLEQMLVNLERKASAAGVRLLHAMRADDPAAYPDLDRALESCENQLIESFATSAAVSTRAGWDFSLQNSILFKDFSESDKQALLACFEAKTYVAGEKILRIGEVSRNLHLITEGHVNVFLLDQKIRVAAVKVGAMLGEVGFLFGAPRAADAIALGGVVTQSLSYERFEALSKRRPEIAGQLLRNLCHELLNRSRSLQMQLERERN